VALRDAFDSVGRRLEEVAREMRGEVKSHELPRQGRVARLVPDEGFGFIESSDGTEVYFSRDNVAHPSFDQLEPGMPVEFIEEQAGEGPQAKRVSARKPKSEPA
jgi:cold shock CspA family protein